MLNDAILIFQFIGAGIDALHSGAQIRRRRVQSASGDVCDNHEWWRRSVFFKNNFKYSFFIFWKVNLFFF